MLGDCSASTGAGGGSISAVHGLGGFGASHNASLGDAHLRRVATSAGLPGGVWPLPGAPTGAGGDTGEAGAAAGRGQGGNAGAASVNQASVTMVWTGGMKWFTAWPLS